MTLSKKAQAEKAKVAEAMKGAAAEEAAVPVVEVVAAPAVKKVKKPPYYIAEGKSLTSKKGILGPGEEVKAEYFTGGQRIVDAHVDSGHIIKS